MPEKPGGEVSSFLYCHPKDYERWLNLFAAEFMGNWGETDDGRLIVGVEPAIEINNIKDKIRRGIIWTGWEAAANRNKQWPDKSEL